MSFSAIKEKLVHLPAGLGFFLLMSLAFASPLTDALAAGAAQKSTQKTFSTPEQAAVELATAAKGDDLKSLMTILGQAGRQLLFSGDEVEDRAGLRRFTAAYDEKNQVVRMSEVKAVLEVGKDDWPLPIPITKTERGWLFDTAKGKEEILNRRIGKNELSAIQVCLAYVDAQREYASKDREGDGLLEYAQKFASDPGKKNGLYWQVQEDDQPSPLGPLVASAEQEGYGRKAAGKPSPYHGYYFEILKAQGRNAPRGAYNYVSEGRMVGGFAMVAYPARYGTSGIMTFIVSHDGVVYESNLGRNTESLARAMTVFDPDKHWHKVKDRHLELPGN